MHRRRAEVGGEYGIPSTTIPLSELSVVFRAATAELPGKPHNIAYLLYKHRVGTQLEGVHPMGCEPKGAPNSQHRMLRNASFFSHETAAPVGSSPWRGLQRLSENLLDLLVVDASRSSAAGRISQRLDLLASITAAPLANRGQRDSFTSGDLGVTQPFRGFQNDPRPQRIALVGLGPVPLSR